MSTNTPTETKTYQAGLRELLGRAGAGDADALPALRRAFDQSPELAARLGDLAAHAEQALLALAAGDNLAAREAVARQAARLRGELLGAGSSPLERLLVERVALCWLSTCQADDKKRGSTELWATAQEAQGSHCVVDDLPIERL